MPTLTPSLAQATSDFGREVYCLLGIPIDAVDMTGTLQRVRAAAALRQHLFLSTPNLNFLVGCQRDAVFRESLINSSLNILDGLPLVWMARSLGIPVRGRVTGSGLFEELMRGQPGLSVYFFGGHEGVAEAACNKLNAVPGGLACVGAESPGFGSVEALCDPLTLDRINASGADFLVVSLGAKKGQDWIERNRLRLTVPVVSHLGAVVNFIAGTVSRAPTWVQGMGMEWLWRIKEEPSLWLRYWRDGMGMLSLLATRLLPHLFYRAGRCLAWGAKPDPAVIRLSQEQAGARLFVSGEMPERMSAPLRETLRTTALLGVEVQIDLSEARHLSPAFFGLLLILRKYQTAAGKPLSFTGLSRPVRRQFHWSGVAYLLADNV